jgi:ADP-heptose:LPS heptosyltransferase
VRILFVTATRIGDAVLSTGALRWLIERHPGARVTVACGPVARSLFGAVPGLEEVIVLEKRALSLHWLGFWARAVRRFWDVAVDYRGGVTIWCVPRREGYVDWGRRKDLHRVDEMAAVIGASPTPAPRLWTTPGHDSRAAALIPPERKVLALGPVANWAAKTWSSLRYAALVRRLTGPGGALEGATVAIAAMPYERHAIQPVFAAVPPGRLIDLTNGGDLLDVYACFARSTLFVGNDSGLMHMADAAGAPTLALFGPSDDRRFGPRGARSAVVRTRESVAELVGAPDFDHRTSPSLMGSLGVDEVVAAAERLLAS